MTITANLRASLMGCAAAVGLCAAPVQAQDFSNFIIFGDSLADNGQFVDPAAALGAVNGTDGRLRFTNRVAGSVFGDPYSQQLATQLGFGDVEASQPASFGAIMAPPGGLNYAVGGYRAQNVLNSVNAPNGAVTPPLPLPSPPTPPGTQIAPVFNQSFLLGPNAAQAQGALALISAGGNDIRAVSTFTGGAVVAQTDAQIDAAMAAAAQATADAVTALAAAGVAQFIVPNLPDIGNIPETAILTQQAAMAADPNTARIAAARTRATNQYNEQLRQRLNATGADIIQTDFNALFADVVANPTRYGLAAIPQNQLCFNANEVSQIGCISTPVASGIGFAANPATFGFFLFNDGIHPTTAGAKIAADLIAATIQAPKSISVAPLLGLGAARAMTDTAQDELNGVAPAESGFRPFVSLGVSLAEFDSFGRGGDNQDATYTHGVAGATFGTGGGFRVGAGLGYQNISNDSANNSLEFDGSGLFGLLMMGYDAGGMIFGNAVATYGSVAYDDIQRNTTAGAATLRNTGSPDGMVYGVDAELGGRVYSTGTMSFGPIATVQYGSSSVDAYAETGDVASALSFSETETDSQRGGLGAFMESKDDTSGYPIYFRAEALYEHEFMGDADTITIGQVSAPGSRFTSTGREASEGGVKLGFQVGVGVGAGRVAASYNGFFGDDTQHGFGLNFSLPL